MLLPSVSAAACSPWLVRLLVSCQPPCAASGTMALTVPAMLAQGPECRCGPECACGLEWCVCALLLKLSPEALGAECSEPLQEGGEGDRQQGAY